MSNQSVWSLCATVLATALATVPAYAGTYTPIYQFTGGPDGATPSAALTYDEKGDGYGVAEYGGILCSSPFNTDGCGTVYKLSSSGQETTLVTFNGPDGLHPDAPLTLIDHTLYGSTSAGGHGGTGDGTLFSVHTDGTHFKLLFVFHVNGTDGYNPKGPLIPGPAGVFYGIMAGGGRPYYDGVLFELMPDGTYLRLHDFTGGADGKAPISLVSDPSGTLYGSTGGGGSACSGKVSCGVVFRYVPSTATFTVLHAFAPGEGRSPMLGSIGPDGTLYGATIYGPRPAPNGFGSLFTLTPSGGAYSLTTLYSFPSGPSAYPTGGPTLTSFGALIGTAGNIGGGVLYRYKFNRMEILYTFPAYSAPVPPTLDKNGTIYGAASGGGIMPCPTPGFSLYNGCGTTYSFLQ
jgi:uncharacterized repeat protein (TIGR03803 family)